MQKLQNWINKKAKRSYRTTAASKIHNLLPKKEKVDRKTKHMRAKNLRNLVVWRKTKCRVTVIRFERTIKNSYRGKIVKKIWEQDCHGV